MIYVIKKDGTKELFNSRKIVAAVNKAQGGTSAYALHDFR